MFQPEIWGPVVWNLLFSIVFKCERIDFDIKLMVKLMEKVSLARCCIQFARQRLDKKYDLSSCTHGSLMFDLKNMVNRASTETTRRPCLRSS